MAHLIKFPHHGRLLLIGGVKVLVDDRTLTVGWCSRMLYLSVFMCPDPPEYSRLSDRALPVQYLAIETIQSSWTRTGLFFMFDFQAVSTRPRQPQHDSYDLLLRQSFLSVRILFIR